MKKNEAIEYINNALEKGTELDEIKEVLNSQGKIGNKNVSEEYINDLIKEATGDEVGNSNEEEDTTGEEVVKQVNDLSSIYEKWLCEKTEYGFEKVKKIKDVSITERTATNLNMANQQIKDYTVKYYKK